MNKATIHFRASEFQELERVGALRSFYTHTINYIEAVFSLTPHWRDCHRLYAAWFVGDEVRFTDIPESGVVVIPQNLLKLPGILEMNLVAEEYEDPDAEDKVLAGRLTSVPVKVLRASSTRI